MPKLRHALMAGAIATTLGTTLGMSGHAEAASMYDVTITNLTYSQIFSPPVVVSHNPSVSVGAAGGVASPELVAVAENGNPTPLFDLLDGAPGVIDVEAASAPILPGESQTFTVEILGKSTMISAVGMLIATNDAFFFANGIPIPLRDTLNINADAWDAGSETNSELCSEIPAIPCGENDNPNNRNTEDAEGFLHVHRGVHGGADLDPAVYDWRSGVAMITIQRSAP